MFNWLPEVCRHINSTLTDLYWILIGPLVLFLIILEFFRSSGSPGAGDIIRRSIISVVLLITFQDVTNLISSMSDGIVRFIEGPTKLTDLLEVLKEKQGEYQAGMFDFKQHIVLFVSFLAYLVAYLGVFVSNALIYFVTGILYCVSPLMILMYCSEKTSFICINLYKGLLSVATWRILWSILGIFLLRLANDPAVGDWSNVFTSIVMNVCVGVSMLFIPLFTRSLLSDGLVSMAGGMAMAPALMATGAAKTYFAKQMKAGMGFVSRPFRGGGGLALKEGKQALRFAGELGRVSKVKAYTRSKLNRVQKYTMEGRKKSADFIRRNMGLEPKHSALSRNFVRPKPSFMGLKRNALPFLKTKKRRKK